MALWRRVVVVLAEVVEEELVGGTPALAAALAVGVEAVAETVDNRSTG
jgi:hypothetical protein